jgi:hypothetical protein
LNNNNNNNNNNFGTTANPASGSSSNNNNSGNQHQPFPLFGNAFHSESDDESDDDDLPPLIPRQAEEDSDSDNALPDLIPRLQEADSSDEEDLPPLMPQENTASNATTANNTGTSTRPIQPKSTNATANNTSAQPKVSTVNYDGESSDNDDDKLPPLVPRFQSQYHSDDEEGESGDKLTRGTKQDATCNSDNGDDDDKPPPK